MQKLTSLLTYRSLIKHFLLLALLLNVSLLTTQRLEAQCTPNILVEGNRMTFCTTENTDFELRVEEDSVEGTFSGSGVTDSNLNDSLAIFNPMVAGVGNHRILYTVTGTGSSCIAGERDTIFLMVSEPPMAGADSIASICQDGFSTIELFVSVGMTAGPPQTIGTWPTAHGVSPVGYLGELSAVDITTLGPGTFEFLYVVEGMGTCINDTSRVSLTVNPLPMPTSVDTIAAVCDGQTASVTINGLMDGMYEIKYTINGLAQMPDTVTSTAGLATMQSRVLTLVDDGENLIITEITNIGVTPMCVQTMFFVEPLTVNSQPILSARDSAICTGPTIDLSTLLVRMVEGDSVEYATAYGNYTLTNPVVTPPVGTTTYYLRDSVGATGCVDTASITITVYPQPSLNSRDTTICSGDTLNLNDLIVGLFPSGDSLEYGSSYGVYGGDSLVFPTMPTEYFIRDSVGALTCSDTTRILVTVQTTPELVGRDTSICNGETIDLSLLVTSTVGGDSIVYGTAYGVYGTSMDNMQTPTDTTTYFLRDSIIGGGCVDTAMITVNVAPQPSLSSRDTAICSGDTLNLNDLIVRLFPSGDSLEYGPSYGVYGGDSLVFPTMPTEYFIRDSVGALTCSDTTRLLVTVQATPELVGRDTSICNGETIDLSLLVTSTVGGDSIVYGTAYGVYGTSMDNMQTPTDTTTYFLRDSIIGGGCVDTAMITVNVAPQPMLSSRDTTICSGDTLNLNDLIVRLFPSGDSLEYGTSYGVYSGDSLVFPTMPTEYFIRDSVGALTCSDTTRLLVTVQATPELVGRDTSICNGETIDLSLLVTSTVGGDSIVYGTAYGVYGTSMNNIQMPSDTTTYFLRDSVGMIGCVDTAMITVNVAPQPSLNSRDTAICSGDSLDLVVLLERGQQGDSLEFGLNNYGVFTFTNPKVLPPSNVTSVYYVRDSIGATGCFDTTAITVLANVQPQIQGRDTAICSGQTILLSDLVTVTTAGQGLEYGLEYGNYVSSNSQSPLATRTFFLRDSFNMSGCADTTMLTVEVFPQPSLSSRDTTICSGDTLDLNDIIVRMLPGGDSLEYGTAYGVYGEDNLVFPTVTTEYFVRDSVGALTCSDTTRILVTVQATPELVGRDTSICSGETIDLSLLVNSTVGGDSIAYGIAYGVYGTSMDNMQTPTDTTTYFLRDSVIGVGCVDTAMITVNVAPQPMIIGRDTTICSGETINLIGLLTQGMLGDSLEFGTAYGVYGSSSLVNPSATQVYFIRDSVGALGCSDTARITVNVIPTPQITGRDTAICDGQTVNLKNLITSTVAGDSLTFGTSYGIYGAAADSLVMPSDTTVYYIRDSVGSIGCVDTAQFTVFVGQQPSFTVTNPTICLGDTVDLNLLVTGAINPLEFGFDGQSYNVPNLVSPTDTIIYRVRDSSAMTGCAALGLIRVYVNSPQATPITGPNEVCVEDTIQLVANPLGGVQPYADTTWLTSNALVATVNTLGAVIGVSAGTANIQYILIDGFGCRDTSAIFSVTVNANPVAGTITGPNQVCVGLQIDVDSAVTGFFPPFEVTYFSTNPAVATIDTAGIIDGLTGGTTEVYYTVTDNKSCMATSDSTLITVNSLPTIGFTVSDADSTICLGDTVTFTANGGNQYEFLVYNISQGASSTTPTYVTDTLQNNDPVKVIVTTAAGCVDTSAVIVMTVNPLPVATLVSDDADNVIGVNKPIIFTSTGGTNYEFSINGTSVQGPSAIDTLAMDTLTISSPLEVEVTDGNGCVDSAALFIVINKIPTAQNDTFLILEDSPNDTFNIQLNDSDPEGDMLTTIILANTLNGTSSTINMDSIQYLPNTNYNGLDSIQYQICDPFANCDTAWMHLIIQSIPDTPMANPDFIIVLEDSPATIVDVQANDSDADEDSLITSITALPVKGTATVLMDSTISYVPMMDSTGTDVIIYQVCDTSGLCSETFVQITILPVNDAPVAVKDSVVIPEDTTNVKIAVLANDFDVDGDAITIDSLFATTSGVAYTVTNDTINYGPLNNFNGLDSIQYIICDTALCDTNFVIINVLPVNDPPVAVKDSLVVSEDTSNVKIAILVNDLDLDGDSLTIDSLFAATSGATVTLTTDTLCYTPPSNFNGLDSIKYIVSDGALTDSTFVMINVLSINDQPIAVNDTVTVLEDANPAIIAVQANDSDLDGDLFGTSIVTAPTQGSAIQSGGNINYMPTLNFNGVDSLEYRICDTGTPSLCDTAKVYITIQPVNDVPVAANDTICIPEDTLFALVPVLNNDVDIDGDALQISIITSAQHSMADSVVSGDTLFYRPVLNYNGLDSVQYRASDGTLADSAWVYIKISPVNDAPVAVKDSLVIFEDSMNVDIVVTANDIDVDAGDKLTATVFVQPKSGGTAVVLNDSTVRYNPPTNFNGVDTIVYLVCDTSALCDLDTIIVVVQPVSEAPIAVDDNLTVPEDTLNVVLDVQANDSDGDGDTFVTSIISSTMIADTLNGDSIRFSLPQDDTGIQLIAYQICDPTGLCDTALVTIFVTPINDAPIARPDTLMINQDTTNVKIPVALNDTDVDDDSLTVTVVGNPTTANGTATILAPDSILYTPMAGYSGLDTIAYTICDTSGLCANSFVFVLVGFVNTPPSAINDTLVGIAEDTPSVTLNVLSNDSDIDGIGDTLKVTIVGVTASGGAVSIVGDSTLQYSPPLNFNGMDSVLYTVCDTSMGCASATAYFMVTPVNDAPVAVKDTVALNRDTMNAGIVVKANDTDIDGDALTVESLGASKRGVTYTISNDSLFYTPGSGFVGVDTICYAISDGSLKDTALLLIIITDPNNIPPIAVNDMVTTAPNVVINIDVQANDTEPNGDVLTTTILSGPAAGNTATVLANDSIQYQANIGFVGNDTIRYVVCDPSLTCDTAMVLISVENALRVTAKVLLEGPFDGTIGFMHDSLRKLNLIPTTEPYSTLPTLAGAYQFIYKNGGGGETVANPAAVFADNGSNSIVDWVFVELLRASDTIPVASRAGLLQRNGNIVDIDGTSPLTFQQLPDGDYFLSVRHRNHLGVMTKNQVNFTAGSVVLLDFSTIGATDAFGTYAMDTIANRLVLWAGDGKPDRQIIYNGGANDRDAVFNDIFTDPLNTGSNYNHVSKNYHQGDFDMKGTSIYLGSGNDPDIIFFNVFLHPGNVLNTTLFIIREQIPR